MGSAGQGLIFHKKYVVDTHYKGSLRPFNWVPTEYLFEEK